MEEEGRCCLLAATTSSGGGGREEEEGNKLLDWVGQPVDAFECLLLSLVGSGTK